MADNFYASYPVENSSGVTSLNGQSGALTLVAGTNITIVPGAGTLTINATSSTPTGDPNTVAFFDSGGILTDSLNFVFDSSNNYLGFGLGLPGSGGANSFAHGDGSGGTLMASGNNSEAFGSVSTGGTLDSAGLSTLVHGVVINGGSLSASNDGALARGYVDGGSISASGIGSAAMGYATSNLNSSGLGSFAGGNASGGTIAANNTASFAFGMSGGANHRATGILSTSFGLAIDNAVYDCFALGRFNTVSGTSGSWVSTEPVFSIGNGASSGSPNTAFQIDKDGKLLSTAATKNTAVRSISASGTLSARTDRSLFVDTASATGTVVVTLPPGEEGLEYFVEDSGNNAATFNITFAPNGGDTVGPGADILYNSGATQLQFSGGVWHVMATAPGTVPPITGDPNTVAYFDLGGALTDSVDFKFEPTPVALGVGPRAGGGGGSGAIAHGISFDTSTLTAPGNGALSQGSSSNTSSITASGTGSIAAGNADGLGTTILANNDGSLAFGSATDGGAITASGLAALAAGVTSNSGTVLADGNAAQAFGSSSDGSIINAFGIGASAHGQVANGSSINATGAGSSAHGFVDNGGSILASGDGSTALGYSLTPIRAEGAGSFAGGNSQDGTIRAGGDASFAFGMPGTDELRANGVMSTSFGLAIRNSIYACFALGQYNTLTGSAGSWVANEAVFSIGNGTAPGSPNTAFQVDKDGKLLTTAATKNTAVRSVTASTTLSARTDRSLFVNTASAAATVVVTLPAGEAGLEYFIKDSGANATVFNITFTPNGGDLVEATANITNSSGARHLQFFGGTWYIMNLP